MTEKTFKEDPERFTAADGKCPKCGADTVRTAYGNDACSRSGARVDLCEPEK